MGRRDKRRRRQKKRQKHLENSGKVTKSTPPKKTSKDKPREPVVPHRKASGE